jgi:putative tricarboxylic transport membrane protein
MENILSRSPQRQEIPGCPPALSRKRRSTGCSCWSVSVSAAASTRPPAARRKRCRNPASSNVSVENRTGGGGSVAIAHLIETAARQQNTLMVNGTSIVVRSLSREFQQTFRDVTLVEHHHGGSLRPAGQPAIAHARHRRADGGAAANPRAVRFGGGSPRGGIDHWRRRFISSKPASTPRRCNTSPMTAAASAMAGLLGNEVQCLVMPFTEALDPDQSGPGASCWRS